MSRNPQPLPLKEISFGLAIGLVAGAELVVDYPIGLTVALELSQTVWAGRGADDFICGVLLQALGNSE